MIDQFEMINALAKYCKECKSCEDGCALFQIESFFIPDHCDFSEYTKEQLQVAYETIKTKEEVKPMAMETNISCTANATAVRRDPLEEKVLRHKDICEQLNALYKKKNHDYNDAFAKSFEEYDLACTCMRLDDKLNRLKSLRKNEVLVIDETIDDTLVDIANYAIMTLIERRLREERALNGGNHA